MIFFKKKLFLHCRHLAGETIGKRIGRNGKIRFSITCLAKVQTNQVLFQQEVVEGLDIVGDFCEAFGFLERYFVHLESLVDFDHD